MVKKGVKVTHHAVCTWSVLNILVGNTRCFGGDFTVAGEQI